MRKARPLTRDTVSLRDDRLFIVACDDTYAPKQYFSFFRIPRVQVHVVPTEDGTSAADYVLTRLLAFKDLEADDERWMVLDVDHCVNGNHFSSFIKAINAARRRGIKVALSKPCFELWLLLHHKEETELDGHSAAGDVESELRSVLGEYNKTRLKPEHYPLSSVAEACQRGERLDGSVTGGDNPSAPTTRVHLLWKAIVDRALPSQLPEELRRLLG